MSRRDNTEPGSADLFALERYKYLLLQKQHLNDKTFKVLGIYQTLCVALGAGVFVVYSAGENGELTADAARSFILLIGVLFEVASLFAILSLLSGVAAWVSYKVDEIEMEVGLGMPARPKPRLSDFLRWYETYFIGLIALGAAGAPLLVNCLLPAFL